MREKLQKPVPLKTLLLKAFPHSQTAPDSKTTLYEIQQHWSTIVGQSIAKNTWPTQVIGDKLILSVKGSPWASELQFLQQEILKKANTLCSGANLKTIRFRVS